MGSQYEIKTGPYEVKELVDLPAYLVAQCQDYIDAVNLCMNQSRVKRTRRAWAYELGMSEGALNIILNKGGSSGRRRTLSPELFQTIQRLAGNKGIAQYFSMEIDGLLNHQSTITRKQQLLAELKELEKLEANHG